MQIAIEMADKVAFGIIPQTDPDDIAAHSYRFVAYRSALAMHAMRQAEIDELLAQMRIFVDRVDAGEIRSKHTYAQFKRLLAKHGPDAFAK